MELEAGCLRRLGLDWDVVSDDARTLGKHFADPMGPAPCTYRTFF